MELCRLVSTQHNSGTEPVRRPQTALPSSLTHVSATHSPTPTKKKQKKTVAGPETPLSALIQLYFSQGEAAETSPLSSLSLSPQLHFPLLTSLFNFMNWSSHEARLCLKKSKKYKIENVCKSNCYEMLLVFLLTYVLISGSLCCHF